MLASPQLTSVSIIKTPKLQENILWNNKTKLEQFWKACVLSSGIEWTNRTLNWPSNMTVVVWKFDADLLLWDGTMNSVILQKMTWKMQNVQPSVCGLNLKAHSSCAVKQNCENKQSNWQAGILPSTGKTCIKVFPYSQTDWDFYIFFYSGYLCLNWTSVWWSETWNYDNKQQCRLQIQMTN